MAFQKGLGAVHALSHPLGALQDLKMHHGTLNAVLLPAVLRFNRSHVGDKLARLCAAMDLPADADPAAAVEEMNAALGLPAGLAAMGLDEQRLSGIATEAVADHCNATNPRPADREDHLALLRESMTG